MFRFQPFRSAALLVLAILLSPGRVVAQDGETMTITGTFKMNEVLPTVGADLAAVQPNAADRWWKLTFYGVTYSHDFRYVWYENNPYPVEQYITRAHATSFTFEFFGPDAAVLNSSVSGQLAGGGLPDGAILEVANNFDQWNEYNYGTWEVRLVPPDAAGVSFRSYGYTDVWYHFFEPQLPQPRRLYPWESLIEDFRNGNSGALASYDDIVDLGSDDQPLPPVNMRIQDGSALEGAKGATTLLMTVTLSRASSQVVTVDYRTSDGTALVSDKDYVRTSGTLTFQSGETSKTVAVSIKGDRKREPNETFTVQLSNAVGATIYDSVGVATIINDD
jgi:hypothetical protein